MANLNRAGLLIACCLTMASAVIAQPQYQIVRLSGSPVGSIKVNSINDRSVVAGHFVRQVGDHSRSFPFVWSQRFGFIEMRLPGGNTSATAHHINDNGDVVGAIMHPTLGWRGYRWRPLSLSSPPVEIFGQLRDRIPQASSDSGKMLCGESVSGTPFVFNLATNNVFDIQLNGQTLPGINHANAINSDGVVVGTLSIELPDGSITPRAFRWSLTGSNRDLIKLELLPGPRRDWFWSEATDINDLGDIAGFVFDEHDQSVAFWDGRTLEFSDLGIQPNELISVAKAINDKMQIVGWSPNDHPLGLDTPFLWEEKTFYNLNFLLSEPLPDQSVVWRAHDINNAGVIVAELFKPFEPPRQRFEYVLLVPRRP